MTTKLSFFLFVLLFIGRSYAVNSSPVFITDGIVKSLITLAPVQCSEVIMTSTSGSSDNYWTVKEIYSYHCNRTDIDHSFQVNFTHGFNPALAGILLVPFDIGSEVSEIDFKNFLKDVAVIGAVYFKNGSWRDVIRPEGIRIWDFPGSSYSTYFSQTDQSVEAFLQGAINDQMVYLFLGMVG